MYTCTGKMPVLSSFKTITLDLLNETPHCALCTNIATPLLEFVDFCKFLTGLAVQMRSSSSLDRTLCRILEERRLTQRFHFINFYEFSSGWLFYSSPTPQKFLYGWLLRKLHTDGASIFFFPTAFTCTMETICTMNLVRLFLLLRVKDRHFPVSFIHVK